MSEYSESTKEKYDEFAKTRNKSLGEARIRELAEQAGYLPDMFGVGHWDMPECKNLVELIIRECICQCDDEKSQQYIMQHFGLTEKDWS